MGTLSVEKQEKLEHDVEKMEKKARKKEETLEKQKMVRLRFLSHLSMSVWVWGLGEEARDKRRGGRGRRRRSSSTSSLVVELSLFAGCKAWVLAWLVSQYVWARRQASCYRCRREGC